MPGPGYQEGGEPMWWWKVALHLDEAQAALANAMAHNVDDPRPAHALYHRLREGQAILLEIFRAKGLVPGAPNGRIEVPMPNMPTSNMPAPQAPTGVVLPFPSPAGVEPAVAVPTTVVEPQLAAEEPAVLEADQDAAAPEPEQPAAPSAEIVDPATRIEAVNPAAIASDTPAEVPPADPGAGGAGG